jgi:hypothetical protein
LSNPKIQASRHLTPKFQIPFRIVPENGSAVWVSIHQSGLPAVNINAELPLKSLLPQFRSTYRTWPLAIQFPSQMLHKDVPYGKIIETLFSTKPLEMLPPGFIGPNPGIVILIASPIFTATFDLYFLKIVRENLMKIPWDVSNVQGSAEWTYIQSAVRFFGGCSGILMFCSCGFFV